MGVRLEPATTFSLWVENILGDLYPKNLTDTVLIGTDTNDLTGSSLQVTGDLMVHDNQNYGNTLQFFMNYTTMAPGSVILQAIAQNYNSGAGFEMRVKNKNGTNSDFYAGMDLIGEDIAQFGTNASKMLVTTNAPGGILFTNYGSPVCFSNGSFFVFGSDADDTSTALVQNTGAYSSAGLLGITDVIPNTFTSITVTGGLITGWI